MKEAFSRCSGVISDNNEAAIDGVGEDGRARFRLIPSDVEGGGISTPVIGAEAEDASDVGGAGEGAGTVRETSRRKSDFNSSSAEGAPGGGALSSSGERGSSS